jgi:hypothetical protein
MSKFQDDVDFYTEMVRTGKCTDEDLGKGCSSVIRLEGVT